MFHVAMLQPLILTMRLAQHHGPSCSANFCALLGTQKNWTMFHTCEGFGKLSGATLDSL